MEEFLRYWMRWPSVEHLIYRYLWVWGVAQSLHFVGMALLVGTVGILDAVDAVLDADPAVKADAGQRAKNRVVVVHALADLAVPQPFGIANAVFFAAQILDRAFGQVAVAGVHRHHAPLHAGQ